jgi:glycosyltransferase involved in cell wall biosynthesis
VTSPFFTVAIPTKNRPDRVGGAVRSVLEQSSEDLEVVVCDNSDEAEAAATAALVEAFGDPRVRYERTNGRLSMPDNWEHAIAQARGEYVGILTDRSVFRRDALETVRREIDSTDAPLVNWFNDLYGRGPEGKDYKRRVCTHRRYRHRGRDILEFFVHGDPKYATKVVPKLMTSFCKRTVLEEIRSGPVGRCCPPVAPDFTSGFLMLAYCDEVLTIDEALYTSVGSGNGADFRRGGALADRFRRDLGMEPHEMVDRMPSDACFSHALVLNDLMRVRDAIPDRLGYVELDRAQYYLGCLNDFAKASRNGAMRDEDVTLLLDALEREPADVRQSVKTTRIFAIAAAQGGVQEKVKAKIVAAAGDPAKALPAFDTVFDALAWDAANPREPSAAGFMDLTHTIDKMKRTKVRPTPRPKAVVAPAAPAKGGAVARLRGLLGRPAR